MNFINEKSIGAMYQKRLLTEVLFEAIGKPGCAHHPHGLEDNAPLIKFAEEHRL